METLQEVGHAKTWCGQVQGDLLHEKLRHRVQLGYTTPILVFISTFKDNNEAAHAEN